MDPMSPLGSTKNSEGPVRKVRAFCFSYLGISVSDGGPHRALGWMPL